MHKLVNLILQSWATARLPVAGIALLWYCCQFLSVSAHVLSHVPVHLNHYDARQELSCGTGILLESYPEVADYADSMLGRPPTGSPPRNRPKERRARRGGAEWKLQRLVSKGRLTFQGHTVHKSEMGELHDRISTQRDIQDCLILCFCETWLGERTSNEEIKPDDYTAFRED